MNHRRDRTSRRNARCASESSPPPPRGESGPVSWQWPSTHVAVRASLGAGGGGGGGPSTMCRKSECMPSASFRVACATLLCPPNRRRRTNRLATALRKQCLGPSCSALRSAAATTSLEAGYERHFGRLACASLLCGFAVGIWKWHSTQPRPPPPWQRNGDCDTHYHHYHTTHGLHVHASISDPVACQV